MMIRSGPANRLELTSWIASISFGKKSAAVGEPVVNVTAFFPVMLFNPSSAPEVPSP